MTLYIPDCTKFGVQSNEPLPLPLSTKVAPAGRADVVSDAMPSPPVEETPKSNCMPSAVDCPPIVARTGAWLPASMTVIVTISLSTAAESSVA